MRNLNREKRAARVRRHARVRRKVRGTAERPRLCVYRSLGHIYAQIIDDEAKRTLASVSSLHLELPEAAAPGAAAPEGQAWLINAELSQQRLGQWGLPYDPGHAAEMRRAQLLVAPSGEVLAVRPLQ